MLVIMAQHVADAGNLRPRNFRVPRFQIVAEMAAGLGDDFNAALDQPYPGRERSNIVALRGR